MHIYFRFLYNVLTFNNLIPNNNFKFVFLIFTINNIIGTKISVNFRIDMNKEIEHTYETSSLTHITWRHTRKKTAVFKLI